MTPLQAGLAGRYEIEREIARGGMAIVYLARDLRHHRRVAIKVLKPDLAAIIGSDRFLREIEIAAQLAHPNILPLYDSGEAGGLLYYVMPYVEGETLRDRLNREKQLPLEQAVQLVRQVAEALAYAHARGLVHRDIKPENILFQAGHAMVSDFGIARAVSQLAGEASGHLTESGIAIGTAAYMSPEQAAGKKDVDSRSDIYSLGSVLYEALTGEVPLGPTTGGGMIEGPAADLRRIRDGVSLPLAGVIVKAIARLPADRFATVEQFSDALLQAVSAPSVIPATPRPAWSRRMVIGVILAAIAAAGVLSVDSLRARLFGAGRATPGVRIAVLPFENLTADPAQEFFSDGLTEEMITQLGHLAPDRLGVIARTSAMRYKKSDKPLEQIGRELQVEYVLEGSVRREGGRVRVASQLIRVGDQTQVWADTYERDLSSILTVQAAVAQGVAGSLALTLLPGERVGLANSRPVNPESYEAYLRGRERNAKLTRPDLETALKYYEAALAKDSTFALPYLGIVHAWSGLQQMGFVRPSEAQPRMRSALARAMVLDSTLADAHYRRAGIAVWSDWDWTTGEQEYRKAVALNPNDAEGQAAYAHFLDILGRPAEATAHIQRAIELDPFNPQVRAFYGVLLSQQRRFREALVQLRQVQATVPNMPMVLSQIPKSLHLLGKYDESLVEERAGWVLRKDAEIVKALDQGAAEAGYRGAMRRVADLLAARAAQSGAARNAIAAYYTRAGDVKQAIDWLERAYEARDPNVPYIGIAPLNDPLRSDPRFQELLRRLKLPQAEGGNGRRG